MRKKTALNIPRKQRTLPAPEKKKATISRSRSDEPSEHPRREGHCRAGEGDGEAREIEGENEEVPRLLRQQRISEVFRTPVSHCSATHADHLTQPHLSSSLLCNILLRAPPHIQQTQTQTNTEQNKINDILCALSQSKCKECLAKLQVYL